MWLSRTLKMTHLSSVVISIIIQSCLIKSTLGSKCSYQFIVNEMDPEDCPCLLQQPAEAPHSRHSKTWAPYSMRMDDGAGIDPDGENLQLDSEKTNSIRGGHPQVSFATQEDTTKLESRFEELQKQYDAMYKQMKDLEIKMYKESMHNLELKTTIDRQEQTLKDYHFITERLKRTQDQSKFKLDQIKIDLRAESNSMNSQVNSVKHTLQKHEEYLLKHLDMIEKQENSDSIGAAEDLEEEIKVGRWMDRGGEKHIPVKSAPHMLCNGISRNATKYKDCNELYERGHRDSGVYYITPAYTPCPIPVYCDMDTAGGGWVVFQRRQDGSQNFNRNWTDYREGFGDLNGEFWLGNNNIFLLSNQASYKLRVDLWDFNGTHKYAEYKYFKIDGERDRYRLMVLNFTGNIRDGLSFHNGQLFSTPDEDNDSWPENHCAKQWHGGWWFDQCWYVILNGWHFSSPDVKYRGISWNQWKLEQLQKTEMKILPSDYI